MAGTVAGVPAPAIADNVFINLITSAVTLAPTATDYARDYVEVTGAAGIQVKIKTNNPIGMSVLVRCSDPSPPIALADMLVRTTSPPGSGGSSMNSYTPITATDQFLWSTGSSLGPFFIVNTDVRIRNLMNYDDSPLAGSTGYTNTLTFTVVGQ